MLREMLAKEQAEKNTNQENQKPSTSIRQSQVSRAHHKEDEDFVPVSHQDVEDQDHEEDHDEDMMEDADSNASHEEELPSSPPGTGASLQRMGGNILDLDDDADHSFLHPLMGHLQGRLLNRSRSTPNQFDPLHPYTTVLGQSNIDECLRVETEAFPENERCSREKFEYRLTKCQELSFGFYSRPTGSEVATSANAKVEGAKPTIGTSRTSKSNDDKLQAAMVKAAKPELIALIIATRTPAPCVTDATMEVPKDWRTKSTIPTPGEPEPLGHQDEGGTICIHSLAVGKAHQRKGLGSILLKAYVQRIKDSKMANRIALLAHDHLVKFYTGMGFEDMGESTATFGGGNWRNMVMEFEDDQDE